MIKYNFKKQTYYPKRGTQVSIEKSENGFSRIRFSTGFCQVENILDIQYVALYYDNDNKTLGIKFTDKEENGILKLTKDRFTRIVSTTLFIKAFNLDINKIKGKYDWEKQVIPSIGMMYCIKLT